MTGPRRIEGIRAAVLDLDGTLVHTLPDFAAATNRMLADLDLPGLSQAQIALYIGKGSENLIVSVLNSALAKVKSSAAAIESGVDAVPSKADVEASSLYGLAFSRYQWHYAELNGDFASVYPGALEGLAFLRQRGLPLACLTNKPLAFAQALLRQKGLDGYFSHVFGGDSFARKKPDPLPLLETCAALGSLPRQTLMLGDSSNDAQAARAADCPVLLVRYGYNHGEPAESAGADGTLGSLAELANWLS
ncbi:MAG: phosphoglycolate phosphatase [Burkholderiaceae bacterium]